MVYLGFLTAESSRESHHKRGLELLFGMLEKYGGLSVREEDILRSVSGRPYVDNECVDFSISHSCDLAVCLLWIKQGKEADCPLNDGISDINKIYFAENEKKDTIRVGVDIEVINREKKRLDDIAKRYFHEREYEYIKQGDLTERFYEIWTKNESLGKMLGNGLKGVISGVDVTGNDGSLKSYKVKVGNREYMLSVCFE